MYTTVAAQDVTKAASRKLLEQAHWEPYGDAGDTQFYRQNAVRLSVTIAAAPALDNKTVITVASELMSAELPAPKEARELQYSDSTTTVTFETAQSMDDLAAYYRKVLESQGWKATTDNLLKIDFRHVLIFRNASKDLRELTVQTAEEGTRASLKHQTAAQVAEEETRAEAAIAKRKAAMNAPKTKVPVALPAEAADVKATATRLEIQLKSGRAKGVVVALQKQFVKDGWKEESAVVENEAGTITLTRGELNLSVIYVDPGFIPAEVTISLIGGELETVKAKAP
ncbi:MAG: hypothetical protein B7Z55_12495 [Planctomycetales bacterium 12-60-4]|nr:MAG: hypothetical protein B7Z55_12495 [Planctomycetales bacterium 12-60-4]